MVFTFVMLDKPDSAELRKQWTLEHRAYIADIADRIAFAGALAGDDGAKIIGSLLAIDFPDRQAADAWLRNEPFSRAGVYASTQVNTFLNRWPQKTGFPSR